jgi:hypothetical protein
MKGKVKCTCGWSWNKSDSSKKDMYVCHECGRDNSNNMKNGGWLDNIPQAQDGDTTSRYNIDVRRTNMIDYVPYYENVPSPEFDDKSVERAQQSAEAYNADVLRRYGPQNEYRTAKSAQKAAERLKQLKQTVEVTPIVNNKEEEKKLEKKLENDNDIEEKSSKSKKYNNKKPKRKKEKEDDNDDSDGEAFIPPFILNAPNYTGVKPQFYDNVNNESKDNDGIVNLDTSAPSEVSYRDDISINSANYRNAQRLAGSNLGLQLLLNDEKYKKDDDVLKKETSENEYNKSLSQEENKNVLNLNRSVNSNMFNRKLKNGGWLDNYGTKENPNDSSVSLPEGFVGMGNNTKGRDYSPAWGGQFQMGGKLTFLQPTSEKLPEGYIIPYNTPSSERAMSVGGEDGEPAYLIPSFKYGKPLYNPIEEFKKTGEHLGGPFKTWQEADEWERTVRHPYVEQGKDIPLPIKTWGEMAMGGSIPGAVGFSYARTKGIPSEGPYAKKTMPSAQEGRTITIDEGEGKKRKILTDSSEYAKLYDEGRIGVQNDDESISFNPLNEVVVTPYDKQYPFYQELSDEEKKYFNSDTPIGRQLRSRAQDNVGFNADKATDFAMGWLRDLPLASLQAPQSALVEGVEALRGNDFNMLSALEPDKQRIPSETWGIENPYAAFAVDALTDPETLMGMSLLKNPLQKGMKQLGNIPTSISPSLNKAIPATSNIKQLVNTKINNTSKAIDEHMAGISQGLFSTTDKRPFFEKFPITNAQKQKVYAAQDKALEEGEQFIKDWHYGDDIDLHPDIVKRMQELDPNFNLSIYDNTNITDPANPFAATNNVLSSTRRNILKNENLSDYAKEYILDNRNKIGGVNIKDTNESITLRNRGLYHYSPSSIKDTVIHEAGHTSENLGTLSYRDPNGNIVWGTKPFDNIRTYDPDLTDYYIANPNTEQGKIFQEAMVEPIYHKRDADGKITKRGYTWEASPAELHSELLPARSNLIDAYVDQGYDRKEIMDMLRADPSDDQIDWMIKSKDLNRFFKKTTSPELKRKAIRMLYTGVPTSVGIGAASQIEEEKPVPGMKQGGIIKDDRGQWAHPGEITEIGSPYITMQGVPYPVLGISDTGDTQMMYPEEEYEFDGTKVTEFPMAKNGLRQEQKGLVNLDNLLNFTNYNTKQPGGWLDSYK